MYVSFQRKAVIWVRLSAVAMALSTVFWLSWASFVGTVPLTKVDLGKLTLHPYLNIAISRWWDVAAWPLALLVAIAVLDQRERSPKVEEIAIMGLITGMAFGLVFAFVGGLGLAFTVGVAFTMLYGRDATNVYWLASGFPIALFCGPTLGLAYGLLGAALVATLRWLAIGSARLAMTIGTSSPAMRLGRWLIAADRAP